MLLTNIKQTVGQIYRKSTYLCRQDLLVFNEDSTAALRLLGFFIFYICINT